MSGEIRRTGTAGDSLADPQVSILSSVDYEASRGTH